MNNQRLLAMSLALLTTASLLLADQDSIFERRDDDLIIERRDDDLIEPLDPAPAREPSAQQRTEEAFDRSEGRLKAEAMVELDRLEDQIKNERLFDSFEEARDRELRVEVRDRKEKRDAMRKIYERESDRLGSERDAYLRSIGRASDAAVAGAADDSRKLDALRETYERDLSELKTDADRAKLTEAYEADRNHILGIIPPSTQPTTTPTSDVETR